MTHFFEALILSLALAADAFSVAATVGMFHRAPREIARISFHFGLFQSLLAAAGASLGTLFMPLIEEFDHWVVFVLLAGLGVRMIWMGLRDPENRPKVGNLTRGLRLVGLSLAVSIDAFGAGVTLPAQDLPLARTIVLIGVITLIAALVAMLLADHVKRWAGHRSEIIAGIVLIALGAYAPLTHLGYL